MPFQKWWPILGLVLASACSSSSNNEINIRLAADQPWRAKLPILAEAQPPKLLFHGEPFVRPRGIMLDPDGLSLWVSDPADLAPPEKKAARIIRISLEDGRPTKPSIFFSKPGFLYSAKWAVPVITAGQKQLIIADQGEPTSEYTFTGKGAKVFTLPVTPEGTAGAPKVLWEGPPFQCPTGVALIGDFVYITDPCAGPRTARPEKPTHTFPTSAIFALRYPDGGAPILLKSGPPFTSLIGICPLVPGEIIVNDTDSGRLDPEGAPGRLGFSPDAGADRWVLKITDPKKPALSDPVRTFFTEEGTIELDVASKLGAPGTDRFAKAMAANGPIEIVGTGGTYVIPRRVASHYSASIGRSRVVIAPDAVIATSGRIAVDVASDVLDDKIALDVIVPDREPIHFSFMKLPLAAFSLRNNKHGGARERTALIAGEPRPVYDRFTLDNTRGHGAVWIYPDGGGTPVAIAIGPPLDRPLGSQLSRDGKTMWFTDQGTGSIYEIPFPSPEMFDRLYGVQKPQR